LSKISETYLFLPIIEVMLGAKSLAGFLAVPFVF